MIDTHAHLDAFDDDPAAVVARAREAGVTRIDPATVQVRMTSVK